jgi:hypothetical protein
VDFIDRQSEVQTTDYGNDAFALHESTDFL